MTREEFIKQRCEIDKITEEEFEKRYRVVKCNCGQPYCKGYRCLDLDGLLKENKELKKQLEEINKMIEKCGFVNIEQLMLSYCGLIAQQKEFIKWLEDKIQQQETVIAENQEKSYFLIYDDEKEDLKLSSQKAYIRRIILEEILQNYKQIIGADK